MTDAEALAAITAAMERVARRSRRRQWLILAASMLVCALSVAISYTDPLDRPRCAEGSTHAVLDLNTESLHCITTDVPPALDPEEDPSHA